MSRPHISVGSGIECFIVGWIAGDQGEEVMKWRKEGRGDEAAQRDLCLLSLFHRMEFEMQIKTGLKRPINYF